MLRDFLLNFEDPRIKAHPLYQKKKYKIMMVSESGTLAKCSKQETNSHECRAH